MTTPFRFSNLGIAYPQVSKDKLARLCLIGFLFIALASNAFAQAGSVYRYTAAGFSGTYNSISGSGTAIGSGDDNTYSFTGPPFAFNFDSVTYNASTTMSIQTNGYTGWTSLGTNYNDGIGTFSTNPNSIDPFCCDLVVNGNMYYQTTGSSPNRVFTIEWYNFISYGNSATTSMQVKLYETSNVIEVIYKDHSYSVGKPADGNGGGTGLNGQSANAPNDYLRYGSSAQTSTPANDVRFTPPSNAPPAELALTPKSINFGTYAVGQGDTICTITARNIGNANLHILGVAFSGGTPPDFAVVSGPKVGDSILIGQQKTWCLSFLPITNGSRSGIFGLTTDGRDSGAQQINLSGIGIAPAVSYGATTLFHNVHTKLGDSSKIQYLTVASTGTGPLSFSSIYFVGLNADNYRIVHQPKNPLPFGQSDSIGIRFMPTVEGRPDANLIISSNAINKPLDTVTLFGIATLPHLVIDVPAPSTGNLLSFDSVALGDSVCQTITLSNPGTDTLRLLHQLITYGDYDFSFYPLTGVDTMIIPGASKLVNVCFRPLKGGFREASLRFYTNIQKTFEVPSRDTSQFVVYVNGVGVPYGRLVVQGPRADTVEVGKSNCVVDTFENVGVADLTVLSASITGPNSSAFTIVSGAPFTLHPGDKMPVSVCYTAAASGANVDTIWVSGITSEHSFTQAVQFTGFGSQVCASASTNTLTFGGLTLVGTRAMDTVTITNCGDFASTYTAAYTGGSIYSVNPFTLGPVAAHGTGQFIVTFTPTAIGQVNGNLEITGTEGPTAPIEVALNGVGAGVNASATGAPASSASVGDCENFDIIVANNGNYPWTPGAPTIGGSNASDFTVVSGPTPATIPPNGTATVTVNFCPSDVGTRDMTLTFPNASPMPLQSFSYLVGGVGEASGVALKAAQDGFLLGQSYPNPTGGTAELAYTLPHNAAIVIAIVDLTGQTVKTVFTGEMSAGDHTASISAKDLPSGTYFYTLTSGDVHLARQMTIVR